LRQARIELVVLTITVLLFAGAAESKSVDEAEIQQDVQRIASSVSDLVVQAVDRAPVRADPKLLSELRRRLLIDGSSLLEISTGPVPVNNLLDLAVFFRLSSQTLMDYWIPKVYGPPGIRLLEAYRTGERETSKIFDKVATAEQKAKLRALSDDWLRRHPSQVRVANVRFTEFSGFAKGSQGESATDARGLMNSVRNATATADRALLLAERTMYLAQRMPFLLRLQTVIGADEITSEVRSSLMGTTRLLSEVPQLDPLLNDLSGLLTGSQSLAIEVRKVAEAIQPLKNPKTPPGELHRVLTSAEGLVHASRSLVHETNETKLVEKVRDSVVHVDHLILKWTMYLLVLGLCWAVFGWGGYYVVKRALMRKQPSIN
jgi:hypothetical protein